MRHQRSDAEDRFARARGLDPEEGDLPAIHAPRLRRRLRPAEGRDRETVKMLIRDIPSFLKLLYRLARDPRVSRLDKALVLGTVAYILVPLDFIPDLLPFLGQVDDIYLLALVLDRLLNNAGIDVLLDHWDGETASLEMAIAALDKAGSFLPERVRALLHQRVG
jgi:uncharacterized membrane protein YkvA (DUF1232 family)